MLFALAGTGVAYSIFTAPGYIYTTVNTGTVSAEWGLSGSDLVIHQLSMPAYATISGYRGPTYNYEATLTVANYYPGAEGVVGLKLDNTGSLPYQVKSMTVNVGSDPDGLEDVLYLAIPGTDNVGQDTWASTYLNVYFYDTLRNWDGYTLNYAANSVPQYDIAAGHWQALYAYLKMDPNAGNAYMGKTVVFTITLTVEQAVP